MEKVMQYLWAHRLQLRPGMTTVDALPLQVIDPGRLNTDSGPDFFNAKVKIGGQMWAGNVEIHVKASDWHRHDHGSDPAYQSVILHVVGQSDTRITASDGRLIPQIELPADTSLLSTLSTLKGASAVSLPCTQAINSMEPLYLIDWLSALAFERLYEKADRVQKLIGHLSGNREEAAYITLARALGFSTNSEPFERLARSTPLRIIRKHADNPIAIEAMLLGQAGLIPPDAAEGYPLTIAREYEFMASKFSLQAPGIQWKMARMRPANFPHRRIALLAQILCHSGSILSDILSVRNFEDADALFNRRLSGFWSRAYTFSAIGDDTGRALSRQSVMSLIINVVTPLKMVWGLTQDLPHIADEAIDMLHKIPPEDNRLTRQFAGTQIDNDCAFISQALIQLRRAYCETSDCLRCRIARHALGRHY